MNSVFLGYGLELSPDKIDDKDIVDEVMDEMNSSTSYYWDCANSYECTNWFFGKIISYIDEGSSKSLKSLINMINGRSRITEEDINFLDEKIQKLLPHNYGHIHYSYYLIYTTFD